MTKRVEGLIYKFSLLLLAITLSCTAATYGLRYWQVASGDRQGAATKFQMSATGTSLPATCTVGEQFFKTDATAGRNVYGCSSTNTWTLQGDGTGAGGSVPSGTIAFFAAACPTGWTEYTALQGRYPVGLVSGGTLEGTSGTALTNQEARAVGQHNHTASQAAHNHGGSTGSGTHAHLSQETDSSGTHTHSYTKAVEAAFQGSSGSYYNFEGTEVGTTGSNGNHTHTFNVNASGSHSHTISSATPTVTVDNTGTAGTNAPYVQLRACKAN